MEKYGEIMEKYGEIMEILWRYYGDIIVNIS